MNLLLVLVLLLAEECISNLLSRPVTVYALPSHHCLSYAVTIGNRVFPVTAWTVEHYSLTEHHVGAVTDCSAVRTCLNTYLLRQSSVVTEHFRH